ncbi:MAG: family hydrolase [Myxococcaceae bacterium]|nr:family hydrolase [Myxococcaceae bacterium]
MACVFCNIIAKTIPAHVVLEDDLTLAFLDQRPLFPGHVLLVPKAHFETLADVDPAQLGPLFVNAQRLMRALAKGLAAEGTFVAMNNKISQSVPHLHVHVVPRKKKDGLKGFFWPRQSYGSDADMVEIARIVREAVDA